MELRIAFRLLWRRKPQGSNFTHLRTEGNGDNGSVPFILRYFSCLPIPGVKNQHTIPLLTDLHHLLSKPDLLFQLGQRCLGQLIKTTGDLVKMHRGIQKEIENLWIREKRYSDKPSRSQITLIISTAPGDSARTPWVVSKVGLHGVPIHFPDQPPLSLRR